MDALCGQIDMASSTSEAHCSSCLDSAQLLALLWFQSSAVRCVSCLIRCTTGWRDVQPLLLAVLGRTAAVFSNPLEPQRVAVVRAAPHPGSWCCMIWFALILRLPAVPLTRVAETHLGFQGGPRLAAAP